MKLVEQYGNIGWKAHELACDLHEIEFEFLRSQLPKGVIVAMPTTLAPSTI